MVIFNSYVNVDHRVVLEYPPFCVQNMGVFDGEKHLKITSSITLRSSWVFFFRLKKRHMMFGSKALLVDDYRGLY